ncbi:13088_t:CDS:2, partial [Acaulospora morrowiae]
LSRPIKTTPFIWGRNYTVRGAPDLKVFVQNRRVHRQFLIAQSLPNKWDDEKEAQRNVVRLIGPPQPLIGFIEILKEPLLKHINNGIIDVLIRKHACHDEKTRLMMEAPPPSTTDFQPNDQSFLSASTRTSMSILKGRLALALDDRGKA